jgi:hypothetical protein
MTYDYRGTITVPTEDPALRQPSCIWLSIIFTEVEKHIDRPVLEYMLAVPKGDKGCLINSVNKRTHDISDFQFGS